MDYLGVFFLEKETNIFSLITLGLLGFICTFIYDFLTLISYPLSAGLGLSGIIAALVKGIGFTLLHEISNAIVFVVTIPKVIKYLK